MDAFAPFPPEWTQTAIHSLNFHCPRCGATPDRAQLVWINRRAPVTTDDYIRKWQEFYYCECQTPWWAWSSDRPPSNLSKKEEE
jgi:hypothetical protein